MPIHNAVGDTAQEKQKCAEQLTGLATCLTYVGDRDDPDLGLKVNLTLALALFSLCKAPDNLSVSGILNQLKLKLSINLAGTPMVDPIVLVLPPILLLEKPQHQLIPSQQTMVLLTRERCCYKLWLQNF
ncbi:hypothetical protein AHAS_Ahas11G0258900 [Arachis hypogaea]